MISHDLWFESYLGFIHTCERFFDLEIFFKLDHFDIFIDLSQYKWVSLA